MTHLTSELRAEIARQQVPRYKLAAQVGVHPGRLGQMLNGKLPLSTDVCEKLTKILGNESTALHQAKK
jgi:plasmid maintenance system antidote protein VapI